MVTKTKAVENKPLTQEQIAVLTKKIIAEYNDKLVKSNVARINSQEVTKALKDFEKLMNAENERVKAKAKALAEAERDYHEAYDSSREKLGQSKNTQYKRYSDYLTPDKDEKFVWPFWDQTTEESKRVYVLENIMKQPLLRVVITDHNSFKRASLPWIGCVYDEIVFASLDNKTDAMKLIADILSKAKYE